MPDQDIAPQDIEHRGLFLWRQDGAPQGRRAEYRELARLLAELDGKTPTNGKKSKDGKKSRTEKEINETIEDSFPASDPPSYNPGTAGGPEADEPDPDDSDSGDSDPDDSGSAGTPKKPGGKK